MLSSQRSSNGMKLREGKMIMNSKEKIPGRVGGYFPQESGGRFMAWNVFVLN